MTRRSYTRLSPGSRRTRFTVRSLLSTGDSTFDLPAASTLTEYLKDLNNPSRLRSEESNSGPHTRTWDVYADAEHLGTYTIHLPETTKHVLQRCERVYDGKLTPDGETVHLAYKYRPRAGKSGRILTRTDKHPKIPFP